MLVVKKIIGSLLSSNMYVLCEEGQAAFWIIDVGDATALFDYLPKDAIIRGLMLTHGHFDHIAGINRFIQRWPNTMIYTSEYGAEQLNSDKKNFSFYHDSSLLYTGSMNCINILHDGDAVQLFNDCVLHVVSTPGHCPSCLSFYTVNYLFTGDSYIPGADVVTKLPKGDRQLADDSCKKLLELAKDRIVCAGHDMDKWKSLLL